METPIRDKHTDVIQSVLDQKFGMNLFVRLKSYKVAKFLEKVKV